jgi:hypothetical protein
MKVLSAVAAAVIATLAFGGVADAGTNAESGAGCLMLDNVGRVVWVADARYQIAVNQQQGNGVLVCVGDVVNGAGGVPSPFPVGMYAPDLCFAVGQATAEVRQTITPTGRATLVCQFNYSRP